MSRLRPLFLLLLALWLPLQSGLALAMPFCSHAGRTGEQVVAAHHGHGSPGQGSGHAAHDGHHLAHEASGPAAQAAPDSLGACDQCGFCHLACAGFVASSPRQAPSVAPAHVLADARLPAVTYPYLDRLDRPPLAAA